MAPAGDRSPDYSRLGAPFSLLVLVVGISLIAVFRPLHG